MENFHDDYLEMRKDEDEILTTPITLHNLSETDKDSIYGTKTQSYIDYSIYCQIKIMRTVDRLVKEGFLKEGDAIGKFRYEYSKQTDGTVISPAITVGIYDEITFQNHKYRVKEINPVNDAHGNLVSYEAKLNILT